MERKLIEYTGPVADALSAGIIPWSMHHLPRNALTGRLYRGLNPLLLQIAASRHGFSSPVWGSKKDWEAVGSKLAQPATAGTRVWIFENLVYYPWDRTEEDIAYNWEQTDRSFQPPGPVEYDPNQLFDLMVGGLGVRIDCAANSNYSLIEGRSRIMLPVEGRGSASYFDHIACALMHFTERRLKWQAISLINELRAQIGAGYMLGFLGVEPNPAYLARHHWTFVLRWAELLQKNPEVLPEVCDHVTDTLDFLLGLAKQRIPWHVFKVRVTRRSLPRGKHRPSVYSVRADDTILGNVWRTEGRCWKAGEWATKARRSRNYDTKEAALAALLARNGIDQRTPIVDDANVVSVPVSFGSGAGERVFDFDTAFFLGSEDGIFFLPEEGPEGKWHVIVIISTDWGEAVLAIDGPHDRYVDACEAGIRLALGWLTPCGIRVADKEVEAIREEARSRSTAP